MPSHAQVAASTRRNKERKPEDYCHERRCLWNRKRSGPCPKHESEERQAWKEAQA